MQAELRVSGKSIQVQRANSQGIILPLNGIMIPPLDRFVQWRCRELALNPLLNFSRHTDLENQRRLGGRFPIVFGLAV
jgi:hypothetical protein